MKNKKVIAILAAVLALAVPLTVFAATSDTSAAKTIRGFLKIDPSKLTDKQKSDIADYNKKMAELQKEFINKMISDGVITEEEGNAAIKRIDEMLENSENIAILPGLGFGKGNIFMQKGRGISCLNKIDTSKLTDQQKSDLIDACKSILAMHKELISKMVSNGLLASEKGDAAIKKADELMNKIQGDNLQGCIAMAINGFDGFKVFIGADTSKLTDQQKADLKDVFSKITDLKKDLINKMVSYGLIDSEQGAALTERIGNIDRQPGENGFTGRAGMKKGQMGNLKSKFIPGKNKSSTTSQGLSS